MRTCFVAALLAISAFAMLALTAATPAAAQPYCYYSTADQFWVCPPAARPGAYYPRRYAQRCWRRHGRWVCRYR